MDRMILAFSNVVAGVLYFDTVHTVRFLVVAFEFLPSAHEACEAVPTGRPWDRFRGGLWGIVYRSILFVYFEENVRAKRSGALACALSLICSTISHPRRVSRLRFLYVYLINDIYFILSKQLQAEALENEQKKRRKEECQS